MNLRRLDTALALRLPWPSDLQIVPAGPFLRFFALLIDHFLLFGLFFVVSIAALLLSIKIPFETAEGILLFFYAVVVFVLYNGYFFLNEFLFRGQTPGKMVLGLRVIRPDGTEPDMAALIIRNLLRPGDMFPFLAGFWVFHLPTYAVGGLLSIALPHFRRGGDLAAGTVVIYERSVLTGLLRKRAIESPVTTRKVYALCRPDPVLLDAVSRFMERRDQISAGRRAEIAQMVYEDLKRIFAWSGPDPSPEELLAWIHSFSVKG